jgi:hypothetical protein
MIPLLFKAIGGLGILLICLGILAKKKKREHQLMLGGGLCLEAYSLYIGDPIFIVLQAVFILTVTYKLVK